MSFGLSAVSRGQDNLRAVDTVGDQRLHKIDRDCGSARVVHLIIPCRLTIFLTLGVIEIEGCCECLQFGKDDLVDISDTDSLLITQCTLPHLDGGVLVDNPYQVVQLLVTETLGLSKIENLGAIAT